MKIDDAKRITREKARRQENSYEEARPMNRFFEKEYIPGKGMKNGGMGDLIVGNHYDLKKK